MPLCQRGGLSPSRPTHMGATQKSWAAVTPLVFVGFSSFVMAAHSMRPGARRAPDAGRDMDAHSWLARVGEPRPFHKTGGTVLGLLVLVLWKLKASFVFANWRKT